VVNDVDRAKQFLPFDALKGFKEALELKEIEMEKSIEENNVDISVKIPRPY